MLPARVQHRFGPEGEYVLVRFTRGGQRRIAQHYALALTMDGVTPGLLEAIDGDNRYWEAVLRECLVEAPDHWWEPVPPAVQRNGAPTRVVSFEEVPMEEFDQVTREVATWLASFRTPEHSPTAPTSPGDAPGLGDPEAVPAAFRGRAS